MKITELSIEGFRGFKDEVKFKLHPQVNVFLGVNGSGKTTVLDAVGIILDSFIDEMSNQHGFFRQFLGYGGDFHSKQSRCNISANIDFNNIIFSCENNISNYIDIYTSKKIESEDFFGKLKREKTLPIILYFNNHREKTEFGETIERLDNIIYNIYNNSLSPKQTSFEDLSSWYINEVQKENQIKINKRNFNYINPLLELFKDAFSSFLQALDNHKTDTYQLFVGYEDNDNDRIDFSRESKSSLFIKKKDSEFVFNNLSQGEKEVILMISEIIRRAITAIGYPDIKKIRNVEGIILIDEIEQHLHPKWQRNIIPALTKVFPKIQWFFTTHSPQVLSNLKRENIHLIEDFKLVENISSTYGNNTNSILWNIFGVKKRPLHAEKYFSKFYRALENDKDKSLKVLQELEKEYGEDNTDVIEAREQYEYEYGKYSA